ncbi:unnamed protein product [Diabrotica balteata]|uniref:BED-type domain-containing protein n=1 Tax=Diabrotica balteata TaxID=107213 RepID=A0A9N9TCB5_DIABA|nr:unnamed protein product [Diabrotica balteata]
MKPGGIKSAVWDFFSKSNDTKSVTCSSCKNEFKYRGNTTNMKKHLQRMHTLRWSENNAAPFSSLTDDEETQVPKVIVGTDEIALASLQEPCHSKRKAENENPVPERKKSKQLKLFGVRNTMS